MGTRVLLGLAPMIVLSWSAPGSCFVASSGNSQTSRRSLQARDEATNGPGAQIVLSRARAALKAGENEKAVSILTQLPAEDGASHFAAGEMLVEYKAYTAAAREFGVARKTYKDAYSAGYNEALAYVNAGDNDAALHTANELLNQGYRTSELAEVAATAYRKNGQTQEAYNALRLATHLDPKNEDAYVDLCEIALDRENYDLGVEIAEVGLKNLPQSERLYVQRGVMRAMKGQFEDAEKDFIRASELAPGEVLPDVALGLIAMQMGQLEKSVQELRRATKRHPENYYAQYWFSNALERSGAAPDSKEGDEMLAALEASVRLNPSFWHSRADLGKILLARGKVDRAIVELQKAADLNPSATSPLYLLAQAYRRKGDEAKAGELAARVSKMQTEERDALPQATLKSIVREGTSTVPAPQNKH